MLPTNSAYHSALLHLLFSSSPCAGLTLVCVKAPEASVPLVVGVVGVERQREAATGTGDQGGIHTGLKLLKVPFPTQNRYKFPIGKDLRTQAEGRRVTVNSDHVDGKLTESVGD